MSRSRLQAQRKDGREAGERRGASSEATAGPRPEVRGPCGDGGREIQRIWQLFQGAAPQEGRVDRTSWSGRERKSQPSPRVSLMRTERPGEDTRQDVGFGQAGAEPLGNIRGGGRCPPGSSSLTGWLRAQQVRVVLGKGWPRGDAGNVCRVNKRAATRGPRRPPLPLCCSCLRSPHPSPINSHHLCGPSAGRPGTPRSPEGG